MLAFVVAQRSPASSPDDALTPVNHRESIAHDETSSRAFVADLNIAFSRVNADALPQHVAEAIREHPEAAPKITAAAIGIIAKRDDVDASTKCAAVEQVIAAAIQTNRPAAVRITRRSVEAAPSFRNCIVSAATAEIADLRLAFLRAASEGSLMRGILARAAALDADLAMPSRGTFNPANVSTGDGERETPQVRSPEQPPNNNNGPGGNPPHGNPPHGRPPHGNRPPHNQPPNVP